ncbi:MAG: putative glycoside hydrolase [Gemmatimonadales bacterium]|nr:putative glycoside hydrolase [Gemmatimonadales bacterium]
MRRRIVIVLASLGLVCATHTLAQESGVPAWLRPPHHAEQPPDYVLAVLTPQLPPITTPPPPVEARQVLQLHHAPRAPDYLAAIQPRSTHAIAIPPAPAGEVPAAVRGVYLNGWVFGSSRFFNLLALADSTEVNAFVIDVKDATGYLTYRSSVPTAQQIGANDVVRIADPRARLALLAEHGIHPIARIVVARDPLLAKRKPSWAIHDTGGTLWRDGLGEPWVDAYNDSVWIYAADLAAEAVLMGFREIQIDYVRFPDEPPQRLGRTVYPARRQGESRRDAIRRNVNLMRERIGRAGVPFTIDVFGLTTSTTGDLGIGQVWEDLSASADVLLPMVYPSHYRRGSYGYANPNTEPYAIVRRALQDAIERSGGLANPARIRPYLQAFTIYRVRYGAEEVRAQIQAVEDLGLTDWVLWNARGVYPPGAFRPKTPAVGRRTADEAREPPDRPR